MALIIGETYIKRSQRQGTAFYDFYSANADLQQGLAIGNVVDVVYQITVANGGASVFGGTFLFNTRLTGLITDELNFDGGYSLLVDSALFTAGNKMFFDVVNCGDNADMDLNPVVWMRGSDVSGVAFEIGMTFIVSADTNTFQGCNYFLNRYRLTKNNFFNTTEFENTYLSYFNRDEFISSCFKYNDIGLAIDISGTHDYPVTSRFYDKDIYDATPLWLGEISTNAPVTDELEIYNNTQISFQIEGTGTDPIGNIYVGLIKLSINDAGTFQDATEYSYVDATEAAALRDASQLIRGSGNKVFTTVNSGLYPIGINRWQCDIEVDGCQLEAGAQYLAFCQFMGIFYNIGDRWDTSGFESAPTDICFHVPTGTLFTSGNSGNTVDEWTIAGVHLAAWSVAAQDTTPVGICSDGVDIWVVGQQTDTAYKYSAVGVYSGTSFSVAAETTQPQGIAYKGGEFFVNNVTTVYKYNGAGVYSGTSYALQGQGAPVLSVRGTRWNGTHWLVVDQTSFGNPNFTDFLHAFDVNWNYVGVSVVISGIELLGLGATGIACDIANGKAYLVDDGSNEVFIVTNDIVKVNNLSYPLSKVLTVSQNEAPSGCFPNTTGSMTDYTKVWADHIETSVQDRIRSTWNFDKASYNACLPVEYGGGFDDFLEKIDIEIYDISTGERLEEFTLNWTNGAFPDLAPLTTLVNNGATLEVAYDYRIKHDDTDRINNWANRSIRVEMNLTFKYKNVQPACGTALVSYEDIVRYYQQIDVRDYDNNLAVPVITSMQLASDGLTQSFICEGASVITVCGFAPINYDAMAFIDDGFNWLALQEQEDFAGLLIALTSSLLSNVDIDTAGGDACFDVSAPMLSSLKNYRVSLIVKPF